MTVPPQALPQVASCLSFRGPSPQRILRMQCDTTSRRVERGHQIFHHGFSGSLVYGLSISTNRLDFQVSPLFVNSGTEVRYRHRPAKFAMLTEQIVTGEVKHRNASEIWDSRFNSVLNRYRLYLKSHYQPQLSTHFAYNFML